MPCIFSPDERERIRCQLLREGEEMMLRSGITGMKLSQLSASAGIAKGTFYNFFKTKQHFILAIIRTYQARQYEALRQRVRGMEGSLSVRAAGELFLSVYRPELNPMCHMRDSDLDWIAEKIPASELFDPVMDLKCCRLILSCVRGLRQEADPRIVSNFSRMVMFTLMQRENVHQEVLDKNIEMLTSLVSEYLTGNKDPDNSEEDKK